jgi:hypothetical protein
MRGQGQRRPPEKVSAHLQNIQDQLMNKEPEMVIVPSNWRSNSAVPTREGAAA